jgi:hypothetical protein
MSKILIIIFSAVFISSLNTASAEWKTFNKTDTLRPLECDYRIIPAKNITQGFTKYSTYKSSGFTFFTRPSDNSQLIGVTFEVAKSDYAGLADLLPAADRESFINSVTNPDFETHCELQMQGTYNLRQIKRKGQNSSSVEISLICNGSSTIDDTSADFGIVYPLTDSGVPVQHNCQ